MTNNYAKKRDKMKETIGEKRLNKAENYLESQVSQRLVETWDSTSGVKTMDRAEVSETLIKKGHRERSKSYFSFPNNPFVKE